MRAIDISVTEAARNFFHYVNRAHYEHITFVLLKNEIPFARLMPDHEKVCFGHDLAKALENTRAELPAHEAMAWCRDLRAARKRLKTPVARWR